MISILNNLSAMSAENSLSMTQANLQKTLTQLSSGLRINTGSDDAAGLSIANGMQANIAALTQSSQNATNGVGQLQTADGALSQVTTLLNRAVTLATEAANGSITTSGSNSQAAALDTEFQSILSEVNQIGQSTDFNGVNVFLLERHQLLNLRWLCSHHHSPHRRLEDEHLRRTDGQHLRVYREVRRHRC